MYFYNKNLHSWIDVLNKIFPIAIPVHCEWTSLKDISSVLNTIASDDNLNQMYYPTGGFLELRTSKFSIEENCLELDAGQINILKPKRLIFESFNDSIWNYFRIETSVLEPSGVYRETNYPLEDLTEIEPGRYLDYKYWDAGEYQGQRLPDSARPLTRFLNGSFVIFASSSPYCRNLETIDAPHNKMTSEEFREHIEDLIRKG